MTPERWREIERLYLLAREKPAGDRAALLERACSGDGNLRHEVESLLQQDIGSDFLETARFDVAAWARDLMDTATLEPAMGIVELPDRDEQFLSAGRFTLQKRLGSGSFGVVYRAFDRERNSQVALKKLLHFDPSRLLRFKNEFRSLVDLVHPNLVQLYELFGEGRQWFFTMELVEGVDFLAYAGDRLDRLRGALFQVANGVQALHASGRLHRDLKPSNVLVTGNDRIVILDFGLVKELGPRSIEDSFLVAGTPAYMAPEQAAGRTVSEAADWYAVGVMLYKALTGQLPFAGNFTETLERKQREPAPDSRALAPGAPEDLHNACNFLLRRNPDERAPGVAILAKRTQAETMGPERRQQEVFVGRRAELRLLQDRFEALSSGRRQVILLHGKSGIGKTFLLSHFLDELCQTRADTLILRGRCRESESVPYKALDAIADSLVRYLRSLPDPVAIALLPRHPDLLRRLFPVFGRLEILPPGSTLPDLDEQQTRRRAFEALSELLGRISGRTRVVIAIDDLQWGDLDSVAFLAELLLPVSAPALLLIFSFRGEDARSSPALRALNALQPQSSGAGPWADVAIGGLSEEEGRSLLDVLRTKGIAISDEQSRAIVRESGGSPLLLHELLLFVALDTDNHRGQGGTGILISEMIRRRASALSATARQLLEALSIAGEPVPRAMLCRAVNKPDKEPAVEIALLIREHLVRVTGAKEQGLEPFHDQVREASLSWLSSAGLRAWHTRLAELLRAEANVDTQRLLRHYRGAGNWPAAFEAALAAAANAERSLAFEQAARFYREALETGEAREEHQADIHRRRAEALARAGRGREAAEAYLDAARWPRYNDVFGMRQLSAEHLLRSGYLDEGVRSFTELLRSAGVHVPSTRIESLLRMLVLRFFIRLRGLKWSEQTEADVAPAALRKLDLLWGGAMSLISVDTIFGSYLQSLHMLHALRAGEPYRLSLSLGVASAYETMGGTHEYQHGLKLIGLAKRLAEKIEDPYLSAMTHASRAALDFTTGRIKDGLSDCRIAAAGLDMVKNRGTAWERGSVSMMLVWFLGWSGRVRELSERLPAILEDARSRGDVYAEISARCSATSHLAELAADDPERAMAETARSLSAWRKTYYDLPHFNAAMARVDCLLYAGGVNEARRFLLAEWQPIRRSLFTRKSQIHRTILYFARARTALAGWLANPQARELRAETERFTRMLAGLRSPWGAALSNVLRAGVLARLGRRSEAQLCLQTAEATLREQDLRLLAAAVLRRRGELGGAAGADQVASADAFMQSEKILRPDRMTAMLLPGDWRQTPIPTAK